MSIPVLQSKVLYGLKTDVCGNAQYITDSEVLYPAGSALALHNFVQKKQRLIRLHEKRQVNIITVTPNKKLIAVCEMGEKPSISIYDVVSLKRKKSLGIPYDAPNVTKFACISFTFDSKHLVAVTGEPDQTMLFYNWDKGKVESTMKIGNFQSSAATVEIMCCNPGDTGIVALGGRYCFKFLTVSETVWRPYGFGKAENLLICSMAWLNTDRLLAGTRDGRILYLENGDLKNIYKMNETVSMNLKIREEYEMQASTSQVTMESDGNGFGENDIRCLIVFPKGFAFGFGAGTIVLFERDGQHRYKKRNIFKVPTQVLRDDSAKLYQVNTISVNVSGDQLLVTTGWSQLFKAQLWSSDLNTKPEDQLLEPLGPQLHHGPVIALSMCVWKPVFVTCGEYDRTVRMWDYESETLIMIKQYMEEIYSIAIHPTGQFCIVGFSDKLRFMIVLIDDLLPIQEFPIRNCKAVSFSHNGHLFAAVNGNIIQVYTTIDFRNCFVLKGHTGKIESMAWTQTDLKLVTVGSEGAIYEWDMTTGHRSGEVILKGITLSSVVNSADGSSSFCIGSDNKIREIKDNAVAQEFIIPGEQINFMIMGRADLLVFVTCPGGVILSLRCPLLNPIEYTDFHLHCSDITKMALIHNEQMLISAGIDGTLCFWKLLNVEGKTGQMKKDFTYINEVLISRGDLEGKTRMIQDLTVRIRELETEHSYQMREKEVQYNDHMRDIHRGYSEAVEELKKKIDKLQEDHTNELNNTYVEIAKMKSTHEKAMQQLEHNYDGKLLTEYDKFQKFEKRNNEMQQNYEKRLEDLEKSNATGLEKVNIMYEVQLQEKTIQLKEVHEEMEHKTRVHEQLIRQMEDDADREILEIRSSYESLLYEEKQMNLKLTGENGVLRNKFTVGQKEIEELKRQENYLLDKHSQFQVIVQNLEKDATDLKREISERDMTIQNKEQRISELKRNNQELEKFKFVLDYKIQELKNQIEPRDQEIKELNEKVQDMETELINLHKLNVSLKLQLSEMREKLSSARHEVQAEVQRNRKSQQLLKKIRIDLVDAAGLIQEPFALKIAVKNLYQKYSSDDEFLRSRATDLDVQSEFLRQRDHMERTIKSLRKQVHSDKPCNNREFDKMTDENVVLIEATNALKKGLKMASRQISDMASLLGLKGNNIDPTEARNKLTFVYHGQDVLGNTYKLQMRDCEKMISGLQDDIQMLLSKLPSTDPEAVTNSVLATE